MQLITYFLLWGNDKRSAFILDLLVNICSSSKVHLAFWICIVETYNCSYCFPLPLRQMVFKLLLHSDLIKHRIFSMCDAFYWKHHLRAVWTLWLAFYFSVRAQFFTQWKNCSKINLGKILVQLVVPDVARILLSHIYRNLNFTSCCPFCMKNLA